MVHVFLPAAKCKPGHTAKGFNYNKEVNNFIRVKQPTSVDYVFLITVLESKLYIHIAAFLLQTCFIA